MACRTGLCLNPHPLLLLALRSTHLGVQLVARTQVVARADGSVRHCSCGAVQLVVDLLPPLCWSLVLIERGADEREERVTRGRGQEILLAGTVRQGPHPQRTAHSRLRVVVDRRLRGVIASVGGLRPFPVVPSGPVGCPATVGFCRGLPLTLPLARRGEVQELVLHHRDKAAVVELDDVSSLLDLKVRVSLLQHHCPVNLLLALGLLAVMMNNLPERHKTLVDLCDAVQCAKHDLVHVPVVHEPGLLVNHELNDAHRLLEDQAGVHHVAVLVPELEVPLQPVAQVN
mmetsp:Transcript_3325/g.12117  ORF Transcript_3325/g.12117 Transcript_3325/m.12117 type:complete len:286 (-) Transcript_3325:1022-1879(-)